MNSSAYCLIKGKTCSWNDVLGEKIRKKKKKQKKHIDINKRIHLSNLLFKIIHEKGYSGKIPLLSKKINIDSSYIYKSLNYSENLSEEKILCIIDSVLAIDNPPNRGIDRTPETHG